LTREEAIGLAVAVVAHAALIAALTLSPLGRHVEPPPQRMTVTFADTVADQSTSPKPAAQAAPDVAPDLGEHDQADQPQPAAAPAPEPKPQPRPEPKPKPKPEPKPVPKPEPTPEPKPQPKPKPQVKPAPKPEPKPEPKPAPKPKPEARPKPEAKPKPEPKPKAEAKHRPEPRDETRPEPKAEARPKGGDTHARAHPDKPVGGSKIDNNFLKGIAGVTSPGTDKVSPADKPAPVSAASVISAISRQIKPHWTAPQGVDAEKLVTVVAWSLNPDGTLAGRPEVVSQSGITDSNRPQAQRHAELAIRAVQLAAPFNLPPQVYAQYHRFKFSFDRKLSQ